MKMKRVKSQRKQKSLVLNQVLKGKEKEKLERTTERNVRRHLQSGYEGKEERVREC
jgi:hypothetical protein